MRRFARLLALVLVALGILLTSDARADDSFSWLNSPLNFQKGPDTSASPSTFGLNIDCQRQSANVCSVAATYGAASGGYARLNSDPAFLPVMSYLENKQRFLPVPNSSTFITYTTEPSYGTYMYFNYNFTSSVKKVSSFGVEQYKVTKAPDGKLADKFDKRLAADFASMNFSQNGQWMVISMPNVAMLRINMQTFEVLPFATGFNYTIGIDPAIRTAITNDGRYAVVSSQGFSSFKIYDLATCGPVPNSINGPVSCTSRDLKTFLSQQLPGFKFNAYLKFMNNEALTAYSAYTLGSLNKTALITIGASGLPNQIELLGMGESYISGEGAFNYQGGTDTDDNNCHLSLISYPYLIGRDSNNNFGIYIQSYPKIIA